MRVISSAVMSVTHFIDDFNETKKKLWNFNLKSGEKYYKNESVSDNL